MVLAWAGGGGGAVSNIISPQHTLHMYNIQHTLHSSIGRRTPDTEFGSVTESVEDRLLKLLFMKTLSENHTFSGIFSESHGTKETPFPISLSTINIMVPLFGQ